MSTILCVDKYLIFTAGPRRAAAVELSNTVAASSSVLTWIARTLVYLHVAELARISRHALADIVTVAVDTRSVVTVDGSTAVNHVLAPVPVVACT